MGLARASLQARPDRHRRTAGHIYSFSPGEGDAIATVPRRLAERHAAALKLKVLNAPFVQDKIKVSMICRAAGEDPGADWFAGEVRTAIG